MRHKHADMIIEWANTGKQVQNFYEGKWHDVPDNNPVWAEIHKYRIKPKVIRYRVALIDNASGTYTTCSVNTDFSARQIEGLCTFVRWITEWQEVEV